MPGEDQSTKAWRWRKRDEKVSEKNNGIGYDGNIAAYRMRRESGWGSRDSALDVRTSSDGDRDSAMDRRAAGDGFRGGRGCGQRCGSTV